MSKKGQLTIFMILSVALVLIFYFGFYIQGEDSKSKSNLAMGSNANFDADAEIFETYLQSTFERAVYSSLVVWGNSGGANKETTGWETQEYPTRTIALLYDEDGPRESIKESALEDLTALIQHNFIATVDAHVFEERGFTLRKTSLPKVNLSTNFEGTTGFSITPNLMALKQGRETSFGEMSMELDIGVSDILGEIAPLLNAIKNKGDTFNLGVDYSSPTGIPLNICSYPSSDYVGPPLPSGPCATNPCTLIRMMYDAPLKLYSSYRFDFLVKAPHQVTGCTTP
jgi:hypothetical protein